ncbi:Alpha/Beta hydrolase protein [Microdochium bolleyi]|uniref:Alpha/Beta hydrolase protein n=1 Tax=Microdochium bolleyi TaxID=196109 RepID=A0A136JHS7_9PEZI|nr:Alpha/Beta hydrolase protein [Microdochium bolleyi]
MVYLYATRNFSTIVGLASPEPMANMYDTKYFRATWILTALDAGFWTAMKIRKKWLRDFASIFFTVYYLIAAEKADNKVRKVRGMITVDHLRVSWNKGSTSPYLSFFQNLLRPRFTRWPPRAIRISRPSTSDYKEPVSAWLYYDGPIADLAHINKMILDIPGGGFVAMDPRCNDDKLFAWAGRTGLPVLSLDYKKAPEFPFPYALNECFDVYTTIVRSRGRCIGIAGGNIATAMTLMIIESAISSRGTASGEPPLSIPDGLMLLYPALDMNIGNWMSDEQMALVKDRKTKVTNKNYIRRKTMQYSDIAGTPHHSDDEDDDKGKPASPITRRKSLSHQPEPLRTRLAMSSMLSYFNDRVLTPEMMRAMIILYIGPHNRPDFSQDYLLSPILAPDALLQLFPKTYFCTGERDPLVDDTVIFAGRLRRVKRALHSQRVDGRDPTLLDDFDDKDICEVELIPGISHGFIQFPSLYPPAWKLIDRCAHRAVDMLDTADARSLREQQARDFQTSASPQQQQQQQRHHRRVESSGDEGGLEINMTRTRGRTISDEGKAKDSGLAAGSSPVPMDGSNQQGRGSPTNGGVNGTASPSPLPAKQRKKQVQKSKSIIRLNSSDDLLGRRMQGLAGPLTGTHDHDD